MLRLFPVTVQVRGDTTIPDVTVIDEINELLETALVIGGHARGRYSIRPFEPRKSPLSTLLPVDEEENQAVGRALVKAQGSPRKLKSRRKR